MAMVGVQLKVQCDKEKNTEPTKELKIPTLEELYKQIKDEVKCLTDAEAEDLARMALEKLQEVKSLPSSEGRFGNAFNPKQAELHIIKWSSYYTMLERMRYPADYSPIRLNDSIHIGGVHLYPVLVSNTKEVYLHYCD